MIIRVVLAVAVAVALLAATAPTLDRARVDYTEQAVHREAAALRRSVAGHRRSGAAAPGRPAARRVVEIDLPARSLSAAPLSYFAVGGVPGGNRSPNATAPADGPESDVLAYRVRGGPRRVLGLPVDLRVVRRGPGGGRQVAGDATPLVVEDGEVLTLRLVAREGRRVVLVGRRGFKPEGATRPAHAGPPGTPRVRPAGVWVYGRLGRPAAGRGRRGLSR